jgi:hypothetical protein
LICVKVWLFCLKFGSISKISPKPLSFSNNVAAELLNKLARKKRSKRFEVKICEFLKINTNLLINVALKVQCKMASRVYGHPALEENLTSEAAVKLVQECTDVQHMIDINSEHLDRLRTPMNSTSGRQISGKCFTSASQI